jgi:hypothetical protein
MDMYYISDGRGNDKYETGYQGNQTGVIPDLYTDTIIDSCPVAQLTWAPALGTAPRLVTIAHSFDPYIVVDEWWSNHVVKYTDGESIEE